MFDAVMPRTNPQVHRWMTPSGPASLLVSGPRPDGRWVFFNSALGTSARRIFEVLEPLREQGVGVAVAVTPGSMDLAADLCPAELRLACRAAADGYAFHEVFRARPTATVHLVAWSIGCGVLAHTLPELPVRLRAFGARHIDMSLFAPPLRLPPRDPIFHLMKASPGAAAFLGRYSRKARTLFTRRVSHRHPPDAIVAWHDEGPDHAAAVAPCYAANADLAVDPSLDRLLGVVRVGVVETLDVRLGEFDRWFPSDEARKVLARAITRTGTPVDRISISEIQDSGHDILDDAPDDVNEILSRKFTMEKVA